MCVTEMKYKIRHLFSFLSAALMSSIFSLYK